MPTKPTQPTCCATHAPDPQSHAFRRAFAFLEWALPVTTLVLIPKCPACVAAYALLFTGLSLSLPAAGAIRWTLITLSILALVYLVVRAARSTLHMHHERSSANS